MSNERLLDEKIAGLVRSVDEPVPPVMEQRIRAAVHGACPLPELSAQPGDRPGLFSRRGIRILALVSGAAAVVMGTIGLLPLLKKPGAPLISEIRTEFEIADKNIKIVFIQTPDFRLVQEE